MESLYYGSILDNLNKLILDNQINQNEINDLITPLLMYRIFKHLIIKINKKIMKNIKYFKK